MHPLDSNRCLKVVRPDFMPEAPPDLRDENKRELAAAEYIAELPNRVAKQFIPAYYGFVQTDIGDALVAELVRNDDGSVARPLDWMILAGGYDDSTKVAVAELMECHADRDFPNTDLGVDNLMVKSLSDGKKKIILCECNLDFSWENNFAALRKKRKQKQIKKLTEGIDLAVRHKEIFAEISAG